VRPTLLVALAALGIACGPTLVHTPCPDGGTRLTYQNFGATFMDSWCQSCHGSRAVNRAGAPGEFIFDTVDEVRQHAARIFVRAAGTNDSMPPGPDDPPLADRDQLAEWLACGAP
jgi:uncharacterized membrane protein